MSDAKRFLSPQALTFLKALVEWRLLSELRFCLGESGLQTAAEVGEARNLTGQEIERKRPLLRSWDEVFRLSLGLGRIAEVLLGEKGCLLAPLGSGNGTTTHLHLASASASGLAGVVGELLRHPKVEVNARDEFARRVLYV